MAAPRTPNPGPATARRVRIGQETKAQALRAAGWLVVPPECVAAVRMAYVAGGGDPDALKHFGDPTR